MAKSTEEQPEAVSEKARRAGEILRRWCWVEPLVWTMRMLTALEQGVKGGKWFSLIDKVHPERILRAAFSQVAANKGAAGVDHVILCRSPEEAARALAVVQEWTAKADLTLHPEKTKIVDATKEAFDFLGYRFKRGHRFPRPKSLQKLKDAIRPKTKRTSGESLTKIINDLTPRLRGWFEYFKHSHRYTFSALDGWIRMRLRSILRKRLGKEGRGRGSDHQRWPNEFFAKHGLYSLKKAHAMACQSSSG